VASGKLVFRRSAQGSAKLVLGHQGGGAVAIPDADVSVDVAARHARGEGAADVVWRAVSSLSANAVVHDEGAGWADLVLAWQHNVTRGGMRRMLQSHWQKARPVARGTASHWQQSQPLGSATASHWQTGQNIGALLAPHWQESEHLRAAVGQHWQQGKRVGMLAGSHWQEAVRLRATTSSHWQQGIHWGAALSQYWQEMVQRRAALDVHWQEAVGMRAALMDSWGDGRALHILLDSHWQEAMRPPAGLSRLPEIPQPPRPICIDPARLGRLVFERAAAGQWRLLFVCKKPRTTGPPAKTVIPIRRVYMTINHAILVNLANGNHIPCTAMSIRLDVDSWTWQFSASVPGRALGDCVPDSNGDLPLVQASINQIPLRFVLEKVSRERSFASSQLRISGRGLSAQLDAPYAAEMAFSNAYQRSARQLLDDILTFNGVSIGWDIEWDTQDSSKPTDWSIPPKVFSHQGSYISALNAVVQAAAAYLQPDDTQQSIHVLPRYPVPAWQWGSVTPDLDLPVSVVSTEAIEWQEKPDYNRAFVSGQEGGIVARYTRAGTAGDRLAPSVVDPLITHIDAARQRGRAILSDTGRICMLTVRLPVLAETKIIRPGQFIRYSEMQPATGTDIGLVRSVSVEVSHPTTYQSITMETRPQP